MPRRPLPRGLLANNDRLSIGKTNGGELPDRPPRPQRDRIGNDLTRCHLQVRSAGGSSANLIYAWMYNSTRGSLFLVMVAHAGHNIAATLIGAPSNGVYQQLIVALLYLLAAIAVVLATDVQSLCRFNYSLAQSKDFGS